MDSNKNRLQIKSINEILVIDSRLIAQELGIEHPALIKTIKKYKSDIERFGHLEFENGTVTNSVGARNTVVFCHLNEEQSTFVMTLSRNTEKVIQCKINLVTAFSEAKKIIKTVIPQQNDRIRELELENENLKLRNENIKLQENFMKKSEAIATLHGAGMLALIQGRPDAVVEKRDVVTESIICVEGRQVSFIGKSTAEMGKELGFKTGKDFQHWLEKHGQGHLICQGMRAIQSDYIPEENIKAVRYFWAKFRANTNRQMLLGE